MVFHSLRSKQTGSAHAIILIAVVVLVLIGVGVYITQGNSKRTSNNTGQQTSVISPFKSTTATTSTDVKTMIKTARAGTYDVKCTYTDDSNNSSTIHISGSDKMRIDTTINNSPGHMLWLDKTVYIWADGNDKGSTLPVKEGGSDSGSTDKFAENVDKYKMKCESTKNLDRSLFKLPTNVTFTDFNSQINATN